MVADVENPAENPLGPATGLKRVIRGGHFAFTPAICRSSDRYDDLPTARRNVLGFRVALPVEAVQAATSSNPAHQP